MEPFLVRDRGSSTHELGALANGGYVLVAATTTVWPDGSSGTGVNFQIFDRHGHQTDSDYIYVKGGSSQSNPVVAGLASGGFVVSWEMFDNGNPGGIEIYARIFHADGTPAGEPFLANTQTHSHQQQPTVAALSGGGFAIAWTDMSELGNDTSGQGIKAQIFDSSGNRIGGEIEVNSTTPMNQYNPAIAGLPGGGFVVTWTDSDSHTVRAQIFDPTGAKVGAEIVVPSGAIGGEHGVAVTDGHALTAADFVL